jgi:hypothetical protein
MHASEYIRAIQVYTPSFLHFVSFNVVGRYFIIRLLFIICYILFDAVYLGSAD